LFGRRTYEDFYSYWPNQTDGNPFTDVLNISEGCGDRRARTRNHAGKDITVLGSGDLLQALKTPGYSPSPSRSS
jgi:dihydrofolate reductase